jgi:hypothetical protein
MLAELVKKKTNLKFIEFQRYELITLYSYIVQVNFIGGRYRRNRQSAASQCQTLLHNVVPSTELNTI